MDKISVPIQVEADEQVPIYATESSSGADVKAKLEQSITILPGSTALIPTGIRMEIPSGYEIQVRPRSGLALKHAITVLNTPGTIDADYRGEISVILINHGREPFVVQPNMRIAQLVLAPVVQALFLRNEALSTTLRGEGGFGHTGTN